jgi:hypothetical protein
MNKEKTLLFVTALLVLLNLSLVGMMFLQKRFETQGEFPKNEKEADERLRLVFGFNEDQMVLIKKSREKNKLSLLPFQKDLQRLSSEYYMSNPSNIAQRDSLIVLIHRASDNIYKINNDHFDELRVLIKPDQKDKFEKLIFDIVNRRQHEKK